MKNKTGAPIPDFDDEGTIPNRCNSEQSEAEQTELTPVQVMTLSALLESGGNVAKAAKSLDVAPSTVFRRLQDAELSESYYKAVRVRLRASESLLVSHYARALTLIGEEMEERFEFDASPTKGALNAARLIIAHAEKMNLAKRA